MACHWPVNQGSRRAEGRQQNDHERITSREEIALGKVHHHLLEHQRNEERALWAVAHHQTKAIAQIDGDEKKHAAQSDVTKIIDDF
jgi:hypothetical protein